MGSVYASFIPFCCRHEKTMIELGLYKAGMLDLEEDSRPGTPKFGRRHYPDVVYKDL